MTGVVRNQQSAKFPPIGYGYVVLPEKIEREKYVKTCYRRERVSIMLDQGGGVVFDCYITQQALQNIKFPLLTTDLGSLVCFVSQQFNTLPIIIGVISKGGETQLLTENSFNIQKSVDNNRVNISGNGKGELLINLEAEENAIVKINVKGEGASTELNCDGKTTITAASEININSLSSISQNFINNDGEVEVKLKISEDGLRYEDLNSNTFEISTADNVLKMFGGSEPLVKGNELKTQLDKLNTKFNAFLTAFTDTPVVPGDGGAVGQTAVITATTALRDADFNNIRSEKSFTK